MGTGERRAERIASGAPEVASRGSIILSSDPCLRLVPSLVPASTCKRLVALSAQRLRPARAGSEVALGAIADAEELAALIGHRIAFAAGAPREQQEPALIRCFRPGETEEAHYDFLDPSSVSRSQSDEHGQRSTTVLIYLNDNYYDGETHFPLLLRRYRGSTGDALVWRNVRGDGRPDLRMLHAELAPSFGEKWLLSACVRSKRNRPAF